MCQNKTETFLKSWLRKITITHLTLPSRSLDHDKILRELVEICRCVHCFNFTHWLFSEYFFFALYFSRSFAPYPLLNKTTWVQYNMDIDRPYAKKELISVPPSKIKGIIADNWTWSQNRFQFASVPVHCFLFSYANCAQNNAGCLYSIVKSITKDFNYQQ